MKNRNNNKNSQYQNNKKKKKKLIIKKKQIKQFIQIIIITKSRKVNKLIIHKY